mmetsp:Transcript_4037/g.9956  ORF Transcript_4037/g.9956 Transcript_4037/m.9956 type:complete len:1020 (+) Transcript_4037:595-3654(+)
MSSPPSKSTPPPVQVETVKAPMGRQGTKALADDISVSISTVSVNTSRARGGGGARGAFNTTGASPGAAFSKGGTSHHPDDISLSTYNVHGGPPLNDSLNGGDNHSLLGVIVDRSSFDEDDELTTFGGGKEDLASVMIDEESSVITGLPTTVSGMRQLNNPTPGGGGGVVMRNGKVRRRLRWKPRFGRKKSDGSGDNMSSNASVVSALTSRTTATHRSTATSRSIFSHFSKRSMNSFHTFHSTETPVVTNRANRPQAPHTVMRPNYQDSFDAKKGNDSAVSSSKYSTIDNEGQQKSSIHRNTNSLERSSTLPYRLQGSGSTPMSPITEGSPRANPQFSSSGGIGASSSSSTANSSGSNVADPSRVEKPTATPPKPRRPPLFKRRLRNMNKKGIYSSASIDNNSVTSDSGGIGSMLPMSPAESTQNSSSSSREGAFVHGTHTAPTASLSASISIERENSILPTLSAEEYEGDRLVSLHGSPLPSLSPASNSSIVAEDEKKDDEGEEVVALNASRIDGIQLEDSSTTNVIGSKPMNSVNAVASGALEKQQRTGSYSSSNSQAGASSQSSAGGDTTPGRASPGFGSRARKYNRPVDSMTPPTGGRSAGSPGRRSIPADIDDGTFFEAEHNLRAIHEMAQEHLIHGEYEEAADVFEEILRGQKERYGQDHYRVGTALHNLGIVYLKKGDYDKAIEICGRAVQVRKESLVPNHPDVAVSLAQLGVAHLESRHYEKALNAFQDALNIRRNFLGPRHPKCSKILNNIGCALYAMEEYEKSKLAFDEALDIQRETLRHLPSSEGAESNGMQSNALLLSTASTLCNIGSIKLRWGEYEHALVALDEALLIQQSVLGDSHPTVKSTLESISFIEAVREGPLQAATNNLLQGANAVCNAGRSSNVASMLGFEAFDSSSPLQWFHNSCGVQEICDGKNNLNDMSFKNKRESLRSSGRAKVYSGDSLADKDDDEDAEQGKDVDDGVDGVLDKSASASMSSQSTPTSCPSELSPTTDIRPPSTTTLQRRRIENC